MIADTPFAALVAAHRSGFTAGLEQPEPAECCSDFLADPESDEDGPMQMLAVAIVTAFVALAALVAVFA